MIAAFDVQYVDEAGSAVAAGVVFDSWDSPNPVAEYCVRVNDVKPYVPGQFFLRELPCLLAVLGRIREPIQAAVVDGYVQLDGRHGLGQYLYEQLEQRVPVIGVAKTKFAGAASIEALRGTSRRPLYITSIGIDPEVAANQVRRMHGKHRMPTLLKRVDQIARTATGT